MYHHPPFGNRQVKAGFVSRRKAVTERRRQAGSAIGQEVIKPQPWLALSDLRDLYATVALPASVIAIVSCCCRRAHPGSLWLAPKSARDRFVAVTDHDKYH